MCHESGLADRGSVRVTLAKLTPGREPTRHAGNVHMCRDPREARSGSVTSFLTGSRAPPARGRAAGGAGAPSSRTPTRCKGTRKHARPGNETSAMDAIWPTGQRPRRWSPSIRRPDPEGFARHRPASRARSVAARWPPATLDPGHRRTRRLAIGSVALLCLLTPSANQGPHGSGPSQDRPRGNAGDNVLESSLRTLPRVL